MKKIFSFIAVFLMAGMLAACGQRVDPGHVGIKVDLWGSDRGVQRDVLTTGWYWVGPGSQLYEFPTFEQNYVFTKADTKDSPGDESVYFQSSQGLQMSVDVGLQYQLEASKVPVLFEKYRRGVEEITRIYLRNMIRDSINQYATHYNVEDMIGPKKAEFLEKVEGRVRDEVNPFGINIKNISFISEIRVPEVVRESINAKLRAGQIALQREAEVQEAKANAQKEIERNRGIADSLKLTSQAEAAAIAIRGKALRENPEILQLQAVEKWNGILPTMIGGNSPMPFISVPSGK